MDDTCHDVLFLLILVCHYISLVLMWRRLGYMSEPWLLTASFSLLFTLVLIVFIPAMI